MRSNRPKSILRKIEKSILHFFHKNELDFKISRSNYYDFSFIDSKKGEIACYIQSNIDQNEFSINIDSFNRLRKLLDSKTFKSVYLINNFGWYDLNTLINNLDLKQDPKNVYLSLDNKYKIDKIHTSNSLDIELKNISSVLTAVYDKEYLQNIKNSYIVIGSELSWKNPFFVRQEIACISMALVKMLINEDCRKSIKFLKEFDFVPKFDSAVSEKESSKFLKSRLNKLIHPEISKATINNFSRDLIKYISFDSWITKSNGTVTMRVDKKQIIIVESLIKTLEDKLLELLDLVVISHKESKDSKFDFVEMFWDTSDHKSHIISLDNTLDNNYYGRFLSSLVNPKTYLYKVLKRISLIDLADTIANYEFLKHKEVTSVIREEYYRFLHPELVTGGATLNDHGKFDQLIDLKAGIPKNLLINDCNVFDSSYSYIRTLKSDFPDYTGSIFVRCSAISKVAFYLSELEVTLLEKDDLRGHLPIINLCIDYVGFEIDNIFRNFIESNVNLNNIVLKILQPYLIVQNDTPLIFKQLLNYIKHNRISEIIQYKRYAVVSVLLQIAKDDSRSIFMIHRSPINIQKIKNRFLLDDSDPFDNHEDYIFEQEEAWKYSVFARKEYMPEHSFVSINNDDSRIKKLGLVPKRFIPIKGIDIWSDKFCYLEDLVVEPEIIEVSSSVLPTKYLSEVKDSNILCLDISANQLTKYTNIDKDEWPFDIDDTSITFNELSFIREFLNPSFNDGLIDSDEKYKFNKAKLRSIRSTYNIYKPGNYILLERKRLSNNYGFSKLITEKPFVLKADFSATSRCVLLHYMTNSYEDIELTKESDIDNFIFELNQRQYLDQIHLFSRNPNRITFDDIKLIRFLKHEEKDSKDQTISVDYDSQKSLILEQKLEDHKKLLEKELLDERLNEKNQSIHDFFTGRFHHQKTTIQRPLEFIINKLKSNNIEDLQKFIASEKGLEMLKINVDRAKKANNFIEDLYKFYSKKVNSIDYSVNDLGVYIQNAITKYKKENTDLMREIKINYKGLVPTNSSENIKDEDWIEPYVKIDEEFIDFTFFELINNSLKYAYNKVDKKKIIDITFDTDGQRFIIYYNDNGIGFMENDIDQVFEYAERMQVSNNDKVSGSGYGLWSMKNYLNKYEGDIVLNSPSEFVITLPIYAIKES
jgi:signal transduction histidine kinase